MRDGEVGDTADKVDETENVELSEEQRQREMDIYKHKLMFLKRQSYYAAAFERIGVKQPSSIDIVGHKIGAHEKTVRLLSPPPPASIARIF
jgi:hypothetical protein